jgi:L-amino acid N-acyltransferase YncA
VRIRDANRDDWPRIWPFWRRIVAAGDTYAWDPETTEPTARDLWMPSSARAFVAETKGAIVASAYLKSNYGGPAAHVANAGFMVDPDYSGQGIGRRLAEHVLGEARRDGYRAMVFNSVVETNPAVELWRLLGFIIVGTVPEAFDHPVHGKVGVHIMHRKL